VLSRLKRFLKHTFPRSYQTLYSAKVYLARQGRTEYKVLRQMARTALRDRWKRAPSWREVLPMQPPRPTAIDSVGYRDLSELRADLDANGLSYSVGMASVYLPPATLQKGPFHSVCRYYPPNVGLKIFHEAEQDAAVRDTTPNHPSDRQGLSRAGERVLVANLLYAADLGPRLYDVIRLKGRHASWPAYVLDHIEGTQPSAAECDEGLRRIRELEARHWLNFAVPLGDDTREIRASNCSGNALTDANGRFRYLEFQNFELTGYEGFLEETARRSVPDVHFGEESLLRNRKYLYQSVPGVRLPAKRSIEYRAVMIGRLIEQAGLSVEGRLVLDIGCNTGMMMAEYLKQGAAWSHGWDREAIVTHTDALLLALGCTRFSTTGASLARARALERDLPTFAQSLLAGSVISYLAVRMHLGWLDALASIPWSFLIYEGHQYETREDLAKHVAELRDLVSVEIVAVDSYSEGVSNERIVAIIANSSSKS